MGEDGNVGVVVTLVLFFGWAYDRGLKCILRTKHLNLEGPAIGPVIRLIMLYRVEDRNK